MKLMCWNCCGLGKPRAVRAFAELVRDHNPQILFLSETRLRKEKIERVRIRLGFANNFVVELEGGGGLMLLWVANVNLAIQITRRGILMFVLQKSEQEIGGALRVSTAT